MYFKISKCSACSVSSQRHGFTLVEVMVVALLSMILAGVAFSIFRLNSSYYLMEDSRMEINQSLRVALNTLSRDVRMAGNGNFLLGSRTVVQAYVPAMEVVLGTGTEFLNQPTWFRNADTMEYGITEIFGVDGEENRPDSLTVFSTDMEYSFPLGQVESATGNSLKLFKEVPDGSIRSDDMLVLVNNSTGIILEFASLSSNGKVVDWKANGRFTSPTGPPNDFTVAGSYLFNIKNLRLRTYYIDQKSHYLMANHYDLGVDTDTTEVVAENIEDLQVFYFFDQEKVDFERLGEVPDMDTDKLRNSTVKAVVLGLTGISSGGNRHYKYKRPALFNHQGGTILDDRLRNVMVETVFIRNSL